mmetsp:Transcript_5082/g.9007  ORF Transcript_5082/g.9007 Transcript_5082/m.9007 type:complete len:352 (+) Transcript_5082:3-1058(+)
MKMRRRLVSSSYHNYPFSLRSLVVMVFLGSSFWSATLRRSNRICGVAALAPRLSKTSRISLTSTSFSSAVENGSTPSSSGEQIKEKEKGGSEISVTPWNHPSIAERAKNPHAFRSRQHVNPLASKFQQHTVLPEDWPRDVFDDLSKPLFLDIGCSRGGFLLDIASQRPGDYNYLGLEIRPIIAFQAQQRVPKHNLVGRVDFVGCNANVDLERLLTLYTEANNNSNNHNASVEGDTCNLKMVCIQFPDPHFKSRHAKRRVVTPELVETLAQFMPPGATVFLQSDVQPVLDEMRRQFREYNEYFEDANESLSDYVEENIFGIPTERELSVLERGLPVFRTTFTRTTRTADLSS